MSSIILIGMPGAGKSTIGMELSDALNVGWIDTDKLIERKIKNKLSTFIEQFGVEEFKAVEEAILLDLDVRGCIISTGGSVIYSQRGMEHLKKLGKIVYLQATYELIETRIAQNPDRGIVAPAGITLKEIYDSRVPKYEQWADYTFDASQNMVDLTYDIIKTVDV